MSDSYYKTIEGKHYDREMLEIADEAIAGAGDGRISVEDAQKLLGAVKDANKYTDIEKSTMKYIRENISSRMPLINGSVQRYENGLRQRLRRMMKIQYQMIKQVRMNLSQVKAITE